MLTPVQAEDIASHRRKWRAIAVSTAPLDRSAVEREVGVAYRNAGLIPPERFIWCAGPAALESSWNDMVGDGDGDDGIGSNVRDEIFTVPQGRASSGIRNRVGYEHEVFVYGAMRPWNEEPTRDMLGDFGVDDRDARPRRRRRTRLSRRLSAWINGPSEFAKSNTWHAGFGPRQYAWLGVFDYFRRVHGLEQETQSVHHLLLLSEMTGWVLPHEKVCWLADRPTEFRVDPAFRLHSAVGPALAYADGSRWYAWKGVPVPEWVIERPDEISAHLIENLPDPVMRRCLIEIMTPEKYVTASRALCISEDETGKLWIRAWPDARFDGWAAVEVINGTPELDGSYKHYFLQVPFSIRTARAAVAWTYGLSEHEYSALTFRT